MTTKTLLMFAATGLLTPVALEGVADAGGKVMTTTVLGHAENDLARTANGRLRRTDDEQAGNEMPQIAFAGDGIHGYYYSMTTELPPTTAGGPVRPANHRVQLAMTPFVLQQAADGSVEAVADTTRSMFITDNNGNDYRNSHHPMAFALNANTQCVEYNYQPNNDTQRYLQCFDSMTGANLLSQTKIFAKNNDDASQAQDDHAVNLAQIVGPDHYMVAWRGANGNGSDDGWVQLYKLTQTTAGGPVTFQNMFDASVAPREERTRGQCSVGTDRNTAICTWTEGNTQPQRDGTWMAAIDITPGKFSGARQQNSIIWKEQIEGRKDIDGLRTYSMRAAHERIMTIDPTTGDLTPTDNLLWYSNDLRGNNNGNAKGGTVMRTMMGVIKADKTGLSYVMPLTDTSSMLRGLGGTHLGMKAALFGTDGALKPGVVFTNGSHTGGYFAGQARSLVFDTATNTFADGGMIATAPNDRHLYSNYLGGNPGNQGRNFTGGLMVKNPFVGQNGNTDKLLMVIATTGKPMDEVGMPQYKMSAFLTVIPVAQEASQPQGSGSGDPVDPTNPDPTDPNDPGASPSSLGGCSAGGSAGFGAMLLLGLAFIIRRRR